MYFLDLKFADLDIAVDHGGCVIVESYAGPDLECVAFTVIPTKNVFR